MGNGTLWEYLDPRQALSTCSTGRDCGNEYRKEEARVPYLKKTSMNKTDGRFKIP